VKEEHAGHRPAECERAGEACGEADGDRRERVGDKHAAVHRHRARNRPLVTLPRPLEEVGVRGQPGGSVSNG